MAPKTGFFNRNSLIFAESGITIYIRSLRNPQQIQCAAKIDVTDICTRNPWNFCKWNPINYGKCLKTCLSILGKN